MRRSDIDALLAAHGGRARPVAFLHVLRQQALEPDDHAFLNEHIAELGATDLLRWRARCDPGRSGAIMRRLAELAVVDPATFEYDVLGVPRLELAEEEWRELEDLLRGKVDDAIVKRVAERGARPASEARKAWTFTPGVIKSAAPLFFEEDDIDVPLPDERSIHDRSMSEIVAERKRGELAMTDRELAALALQRAKTSREDWSIASLEFPDALGGAVLEKARRTRDDAERANLLEWLDVRGESRASLLGVAIEAICAGCHGAGLLSWLSRKLTTRAAWDRHGKEVLAALVGRRAFAEIGELAAVAWSEAGRGGKEPPRRLVESIQVALALALIDVARAAIERGDRGGAMAALSALTCLDPPSRVSRSVHDLRALAGVPSDVLDLIAANERLVKHSDARDASIEGIVAALHAMADAESANGT